MSRRSGIRVLVVDDSPYTRQILRSILEKDPLVGEVEGAGNGQLALRKAARRPPDLVTLDLQMPTMDGFTFLRLFRARAATPVLVVSSYADLQNVERALELGASGFISKPGNPYRALETISEELRLKVRQHLAGLTKPPSAPSARQALPKTDPGFPVVAIGSSSGGPPTLQYLLSGIPRDCAAAVLIAQHMPPGFTESLARRLDALLPVTVREARSGDPVRPGEVLFAPGGRHMTVESRGDGPIVTMHEAAREIYVPSVDRLFHSAATVFGKRVTAVVLTGMGRDGSLGLRTVKELGGSTIAESEETAAIYGMPKEAAATGLVDEILPLPEISVRLIRLMQGGERPALAPLPRPPVLPG